MSPVRPPASDGGIVLDQITGKDIETAWPLFAAHFAQAFRRAPADLTLAEIRSQALENRMALWAIYRRARPVPLLGAAATGIVPHGDERMCVIFACAGRDVKQWLRPVMQRGEELARRHDVQWFRIEGRPGWARLLPDFSVCWFRDGRIRMEKKL